MAMTNILDNAKKMLDDIKRQRKFKKANLERAEKAELTARIAACNGELNKCRVNFRTAIKEQCRNIAEGEASGFDTVAQEQIMWDAAVGYMLMEDAAYALKTVSTYDSVLRAYSALDAASKKIGGKRTKLSKVRAGGNSYKDLFGNVDSSDLVRNKESQLDSFFAVLKKTGDIDACLHGKKMQSSNAAEISIPGNAASQSVPSNDDLDDLDRFLDSPGPAAEIDKDDLLSGQILDMRAPKLNSGEDQDKNV